MANAIIGGKTRPLKWDKHRNSVYISGLLALWGVSPPVLADDWGCQVLLCLADPRGPETESACVPPIEKLWTALAHGKSFPTCDLSTSLADIPNDAKSLLPASAVTNGQGTAASNTWASGSYCRDDMLYWAGHDQDTLACRSSAAINVTIDGVLYTRVWWNEGGGATTNEFYGAGSTAVDYDPAMSAQKFLDLQNSTNTDSGGGGGGQ